MIYMSRSSVKPSGGAKSVSTGFKPVMYKTLDELAEAMHTHSHSPSIYSSMLRYDEYKKEFVKQERRRIHNISLIGNTLVYDFDDGSLTFEAAKELCTTFGMPSMLIRSRNDHKYDYDRFKMVVVTQMMFPKYSKDKVPDGFENILFEKYIDVYYGFAQKFGIYEHMDKSTKDASRLVAMVSDTTDKKREFYVNR